MNRLLVLLGLIVLVTSCDKTPDPSLTQLNPNPKNPVLEVVLDLPETPFNYANPTLPPYFNGPVANADNTPVSNPVTDAGATLGRVLFYDKELSINRKVACASCHKQDHSFSDPVALSEGFDGGLTDRNAMSLANAAYYDRGHFFWDERALTLEDQVLMPIENTVEMGMTLDSLEKRLQQLSYYKPLFEDAFGDATVTSTRISLALAQFVRSMISYQSKYDQALAQQVGPTPPGTNLSGLTPQENLGLQIFFDPNRGGCAGCHNTQLFIDPVPFDNGLDATFTDFGVGGITGDPRDNGRFKVPSLRNVEVTAPYMHDGRFATLMEVVEHYNSGVKSNPNLDPRLRQPGTNLPKQLNLTNNEKEALVAFLETLTDPTFLVDAKFSDPFK